MTYHFYFRVSAFDLKIRNATIFSLSLVLKRVECPLGHVDADMANRDKWKEPFQHSFENRKYFNEPLQRQTNSAKQSPSCWCQDRERKTTCSAFFFMQFSSLNTIFWSLPTTAALYSVFFTLLSNTRWEFARILMTLLTMLNLLQIIGDTRAIVTETTHSSHLV